MPLRKVFTVSALSVPVLVPIVKATEDTENEPKLSSRLIKPSDLPIYGEPEDHLQFEYYGKEKGFLEEGVGVVRKELDGVIEAANPAVETAFAAYETGKAHTLATIDVLKDEENIAARAGAISVGGLLGLIYGRRGGIFKKLFWTSVGGAGAASALYPKEAYRVSQDVYASAEIYATIAYNFIMGVKPQSKESAEGGKQEPAMKPGSLSEVSMRSLLRFLLTPSASSRWESVGDQASDVTWWGFRFLERPEKINSMSRNVDKKKTDGDRGKELDISSMSLKVAFDDGNIRASWKGGKKGNNGNALYDAQLEPPHSKEVEPQENDLTSPMVKGTWENHTDHDESKVPRTHGFASAHEQVKAVGPSHDGQVSVIDKSKDFSPGSHGTSSNTQPEEGTANSTQGKCIREEEKELVEGPNEGRVVFLELVEDDPLFLPVFSKDQMLLLQMNRERKELELLKKLFLPESSRGHSICVDSPEGPGEDMSLSHLGTHVGDRANADETSLFSKVMTLFNKKPHHETEKEERTIDEIEEAVIDTMEVTGAKAFDEGLKKIDKKLKEATGILKTIDRVEKKADVVVNLVSEVATAVHQTESASQFIRDASRTVSCVSQEVDKALTVSELIVEHATQVSEKLMGWTQAAETKLEDFVHSKKDEVAEDLSDVSKRLIEKCVSSVGEKEGPLEKGQEQEAKISIFEKVRNFLAIQKKESANERTGDSNGQGAPVRDAAILSSAHEGQALPQETSVPENNSSISVEPTPVTINTYPVKEGLVGGVGQPWEDGMIDAVLKMGPLVGVEVPTRELPIAVHRSDTVSAGTEEQEGEASGEDDDSELLKDPFVAREDPCKTLDSHLFPVSRASVQGDKDQASIGRGSLQSSTEPGQQPPSDTEVHRVDFRAVETIGMMSEMPPPLGGHV